MKKYYLLIILLLSTIWYYLTKPAPKLPMKLHPRSRTCWYTGATCPKCGGDMATNGYEEWCANE